MLNKNTLFWSILTLLVFLSLSFLNVAAKSEDPPLTNEDKKYLYEVLKKNTSLNRKMPKCFSISILAFFNNHYNKLLTQLQFVEILLLF